MAYFSYLPEAQQSKLREIAEALVVPGKGILALDINAVSLGKRLACINIENSLENRRQYRQIFLTPDKPISALISGVILDEEALEQETDGGISFPDLLQSQGIIPGVRVDKGLIYLMGSESEGTTQGLDNLASRCENFYARGCRFARWRSAINISRHTPSQLAINENSNTLARYAAECQKAGIVPIVQPEIYTEGRYSRKRCKEVTETVLAALYKSLSDHNVFLEGTLLKVNMVKPSYGSSAKWSAGEIAELTLMSLQRTVPVAVPGIVFWSGGMSDAEASATLNAINKYEGKKPWQLSFSYGRCLQTSAFKIWLGKPKNLEAAQAKFLERAKSCSEASLGKYCGVETFGDVERDEDDDDDDDDYGKGDADYDSDSDPDK